MGNSVGRCLGELEKNGAGTAGTNCTLNSSDMADLVLEMRKETSLPLIAQANAGQPELSAVSGVTYSQGIEEYVRNVPRMIGNGARIIGGCCGTDPEYIRRMAALIKK